ncbi:D-3-phosphoglycerate dehydrogenase [subsurface metagenome]
MKVLVADPIAEQGIKFLAEHAQVDVKLKLKPEELKAIINDYDALIVRSETKVSAEIIESGKNLKVIGRAGIGVDNIDVDTATKKGVVVLNAPTGNTVAAAEHTIGLMLALARNIPKANAQLKSGIWQRGKLVGTELRNKTLGIIGLGNVGSEVAKRAQGFEMRVIAYDPFISAHYAKTGKIALVPLEKLFQEADFITLHTPLTQATKNLIGAEEIEKMKPTTYVINCARGGLIDEEALFKAIEEGKLAGAAFDVFSTEPATDSILFKTDKIIVTPHLGASTVEAQVNVAKDVAEQVLTVLRGEFSKYSVNMPHIPPELLPLLKAASLIGSFASQLMEGQMSDIHIKYSGGIVNYDLTPVKVSIISGLLEQVTEEKINLVNANFFASQRGLRISEEKELICPNYPNLLTVNVNTNLGTTTISGTVRDSESHIVQINDFWMDIVPTEGYLLLCDHLDTPGRVGAIGTILGKADINISTMQSSRQKPRGKALMILALDEPPSEELQKEITALPDVYTAKMIKI